MSAVPASSTSAAPLTKFRAPRLRADTVARPVLLHRLIGSVESNPLTLVSAPAGSGKTTLLSQLAASLRDAAGCAVQWVAIDADDNDANRLFAALVQAVAPLGLTWETEPRALMAGVSGSGPQTRAALAGLVNALCTSPARRIVFVIDDLHRLDSEDVFALLESLIERLPDHVALVLGSRFEPPLPFARWRLHGELGEFMPADLRFNETDAFDLAIARKSSLDATSVREAVARTQGWAVGLTMLLQSSPGSLPSAEGARLARDPSQRNLFAYLAQEILEALPADLQEFVLQVSILAELNPALASSVTGRTAAGAVLDALYRRNLFLTAIDESVPVLRFHDLFRDFLQSELARRHPDQLARLHERAAHAETVPGRAIHHFIAAGRWNEAIALIVRVGESLLAQGGIASVERWLAEIPESARADNPKVSYLRGACAWLRWDWATARAELAPAVAGMTAPEDAPQRVRATFQLVDALNSSGELQGAWQQLQDVERLPLDELGLAELALQRAWCLAPTGEAGAVTRHMQEFLQHAERDPGAICPVTAGRIHCMLIGLPGIAATFERFTELADRVRGTATAPWHLAAYAVAGWAALWRGDRQGATTVLARAATAYHQFGGIRLLAERIGQFKAVCSLALGQYEQAIAIAQQHVQGLQAPEVARHSAVWLRSYRHGLARMYWMAGDADGYRRVLPFLVAPRTIEEWPFTETAADVARGQAAILEENWRSAIAPLTRATRTYPQQRMAAIYCDPRVSLAYAHLNLGERETARTVFAPVLEEVLEQRAVGLLLLDSRKVVTALLDNLAVETRRSPAIVALRQTLDQWTTAPATSTPAAATPAGPLATLSDREQEVLAQVAAGASNKHIARDLSLSLHTVKRHVANILDKLDCASRGQAADLFRRLS